MTLGQSPRLQSFPVRQQSQVPLVGEQSVRAGIRRDNNFAAYVSFAQRRVPRLLQREVNQTIIYEIDRSATESQRLSIEDKILRIGDHRNVSTTLRQPVSEFKLECHPSISAFGLAG